MTRLWLGIPARGRVILAVLVAILLAAPLVADRYVLSVLILVFYFAYVGQSWNLMMGFVGQLSLGHALYVGLGAYLTALLWVNYGISPLIGVFPAVAVSAAFGAIVAWLGFRFSIEGVYFALLTIAFAEFTRIAFDHLAITGGAGGFFMPYEAARVNQWWNLRGGPLLFYYLGFALAAGAALFAALIARSRLGYQWLAVREDQEAARAVGINVFRAKMTAVLISSGMTAVGGVFYAFYYNNIFPAQVFDIGRSIELILGPIVGGVGTVFGPIVGAFILTPLGEGLISLTHALGVNIPGAKQTFYGLALILIISLRPDGVWPWMRRRLGLERRE